MRTLKRIYSNFHTYSSVSYVDHVVHYIPRTYLIMEVCAFRPPPTGLPFPPLW